MIVVIWGLPARLNPESYQGLAARIRQLFAAREEIGSPTDTLVLMPSDYGVPSGRTVVIEIKHVILSPGFDLNKLKNKLCRSVQDVVAAFIRDQAGPPYTVDTYLTMFSAQGWMGTNESS